MDASIRRELDDLRAGRIGSVGTFTLSTATSTTVTTQACSSRSHVSLMHGSTRAANQTVQYVTPGNGSFVVTHTAHATPDSYRWAVLTPTNY
jgi:hypothetical protein